jgi:hypothetical protein
MNQWWSADHGFMKLCSRLTRPVIRTVYQTFVIRIKLPIKTIKLFCIETAWKTKT